MPPEDSTAKFERCGQVLAGYTGASQMLNHQATAACRKASLSITFLAQPLICFFLDCQQTFHTRAALNSHQAICLHRQVYLCDISGCSREFVSTHHLECHKKGHTEYTVCGYFACGVIELRNHTRDRHPGFKFKNCPFPKCTAQYYTTDKQVQNHLYATHDGYEACPLCMRFVFNNLDDLVQHRLSVHPSDASIYPIRSSFLDPFLSMTQPRFGLRVEMFRLQQKEAMRLFEIQDDNSSDTAAIERVGYQNENAISEEAESSLSALNNDQVNDNEDSNQHLELAGAFNRERRAFTYWNNQQFTESANASLHGFKCRIKVNGLHDSKKCAGYTGSECPYSMTLSLDTCRLILHRANDSHEVILALRTICTFCHCMNSRVRDADEIHPMLKCAVDKCEGVVVNWNLLSAKPMFCNLHTIRDTMENFVPQYKHITDGMTLLSYIHTNGLSILALSDNVRDDVFLLSKVFKGNPNVFYSHSEYLSSKTKRYFVREIAVLNRQQKSIVDALVAVPQQLTEISHSLKTPEVIVNILIKLGMNAESLLVEYSTNNCDLRALTHLFQLAGKLSFCPTRTVRTPILWGSAMPSMPKFLQSHLFLWLFPDQWKLAFNAHNAGADVAMHSQCIRVLLAGLFNPKSLVALVAEASDIPFRQDLGSVLAARRTAVAALGKFPEQQPYRGGLPRKPLNYQPAPRTSSADNYDVSSIQLPPAPSPVASSSASSNIAISDAPSSPQLPSEQFTSNQYTIRNPLTNKKPAGKRLPVKPAVKRVQSHIIDYLVPLSKSKSITKSNRKTLILQPSSREFSWRVYFSGQL